MSSLTTLEKIRKSVKRVTEKRLINNSTYMQPSKRRYLEKKGFLKPKPTIFSKSEDGKRYQYNVRIANKFSGWSTGQRDKGINPLFSVFYEGLEKEFKEQITVTQIFKDNETEKTNY